MQQPFVENFHKSSTFTQHCDAGTIGVLNAQRIFAQQQTKQHAKYISLPSVKDKTEWTPIA
ncbi:MAG: hypothetical protein ACK4SA_07540 [Caldilinea sp.]